jgi:hypothetical protein
MDRAAHDHEGASHMLAGQVVATSQHYLPVVDVCLQVPLDQVDCTFIRAEQALK